jgi:hypothetical protein
MSYDSLQAQAKTALDKVLATMPEEGKALSSYLAGIHRHNVLVLAEDEAFALRNQDGQIKAFKQRLTLTVENGGLVQPVPGGPYVLSAQGYEIWAEAAGACVIFPRSVIVDGIEQTNPHVIRDPNNRRILNIYARAVAFRFSSKGLPMVADWTTAYDVPSYRLIDLVAKAGKLPQAFKLLPSRMGAPSEDGKWADYPFDESTTLWVDTSHKEATDWYKTILNREKKALDFAQTFARRNACKHLSGLQKAPGARWDLAVICWRPTNGSLMKWDTSVYASVQDQVKSLSEGQNFALPQGQAPGMTIDVRKGVERMDDDMAGIAAEDEETAPPEPMAATIDMAPSQNGAYGQPEAPKPEPEPEDMTGPAPTAAPLSAEDRKDLTNYESTREMFPDLDRVSRIEMGIRPEAAVTPAQARALYQKISARVDRGES